MMLNDGSCLKGCINMSKKYTEHEIDEICLYCENSIPLMDGDDNVLCSKKGVVKEDHRCRKFSYDPLKRKPAPKKIPLAEEAVDLNI